MSLGNNRFYRRGLLTYGNKATAYQFYIAGLSALLLDLCLLYQMPERLSKENASLMETLD
jgi:NHS family xanthosine MFS transporter